MIGILRATNTGDHRVTEPVINVDTITYYPFSILLFTEQVRC